MVRLFNAKLFVKPAPLTPPTSRVVATEGVNPPAIIRSGPRPAVVPLVQLDGLVCWEEKFPESLMDLFAPAIESADPFSMVKLVPEIAGLEALVVLMFSVAPFL